MRNNFKVKGCYRTLWYEDVCKCFGISKEENLNTLEILFGLSNRYFWRKD